MVAILLAGRDLITNPAFDLRPVLITSSSLSTCNSCVKFFVFCLLFYYSIVYPLLSTILQLCKGLFAFFDLLHCPRFNISCIIMVPLFNGFPSYHNYWPLFDVLLNICSNNTIGSHWWLLFEFLRSPSKANT